MRRSVAAWITATTVACSGTPREAPTAAVPEPITIAPARVPDAIVTVPLRTGTWSEMICGDACMITELRFLDDGTVAVRRGHRPPMGATTWSEPSPERYQVEGGVVAWSVGALEHRATFVEGTSDDGSRAGWASLGFRASTEAPTRFVHERFDAFGPGYPTREVTVELVFDGPLEDAARLECGASLRARIHVTVPPEPPATEDATETLTLAGRIPCRVESIAGSDELRVYFAEAGSTDGDQAWQRWWQANTVGPAPQSTAAHDALRATMAGVLVANPRAATLRGPISRLLHDE